MNPDDPTDGYVLTGNQAGFLVLALLQEENRTA
jgi:hypothetical protein